MPSHIQHLIFGYWSLDHGFYEDAVKHLTANTVDTEWSANIVATLAAKQQYNQAIKYINVVDPVVGNVEECRVRLKILVHSVVPHAFMFQV